ncbi:MAG TPA: hypothetical protein VGD59_09560 [Acidisarcina sp.]
MTADLKRLSDTLRRDTPEESLVKELVSRRSELLADLRDGRTFQIRDMQGRLIRIAPACTR